MFGDRHLARVAADRADAQDAGAGVAEKRERARLVEVEDAVREREHAAREVQLGREGTPRRATEDEAALIARERRARRRARERAARHREGGKTIRAETPRGGGVNRECAAPQIDALGRRRRERVVRRFEGERIALLDEERDACFAEGPFQNRVLEREDARVGQRRIVDGAVCSDEVEAACRVNRIRVERSREMRDAVRGDGERRAVALQERDLVRAADDARAVEVDTPDDRTREVGEVERRGVETLVARDRERRCRARRTDDANRVEANVRVDVKRRITRDRERRRLGDECRRLAPRVRERCSVGGEVSGVPRTCARQCALVGPWRHVLRRHVKFAVENLQRRRVVLHRERGKVGHLEIGARRHLRPREEIRLAHVEDDRAFHRQTISNHHRFRIGDGERGAVREREGMVDHAVAVETRPRRDGEGAAAAARERDRAARPPCVGGEVDGLCVNDGRLGCRGFRHSERPTRGRPRRAVATREAVGGKHLDGRTQLDGDGVSRCRRNVWSSATSAAGGSSTSPTRRRARIHKVRERGFPRTANDITVFINLRHGHRVFDGLSRSRCFVVSQLCRHFRAGGKRHTLAVIQKLQPVDLTANVI